MHEKFSIIVPAFNESANIADSLHAIVETFSRFAPDFEIILVDDGSNDETWRHAARSIFPNPEKIRILRYDKNRGKGFALACGTRHATGEFIVFLDADLDLHPDQVPGLYEVMVRKHADAVIGSKWHPRSSVDYPWWRRILSRGYYVLVNVLFGLPLRDTQTGLKLFRAEPLKRVTARLLSKRFAFDVELLAVMHRLGYKIVEAPVVLRSTRPWARLRMSDTWYVLQDTLAIFYRIYLRRHYDRAPGQDVASSDVREFASGLTADH